MSSIHDRPSSDITNLTSPLHTAAAVCLVAGLCYLGATLSGLLTPPGALSPLWLGCAFLVAALLLTPRRIWPALMVAGLAGFFVYDMQIGLTIRATLLLLVADTLEILVAALGASYSLGGTPHLDSIRTLALYFLCVVIFAPASGAFFGAIALGADYWLMWRLSFFSEAFALLTLTPAILGWANTALTTPRKSAAYYLEAGVLNAGLTALGYFAFGSSDSSSRPILLYSLVPFLLWSALRFGTTGVSTSMLVVAFLSILGSVHLRGPFVGAAPLRNVLSLQLFLLFSAVPFMALAALVEERKRAEEALVGANRKLIEAQERERARIARELHDDICQRLALLTNELGQLKEDSPNLPAESVGRLGELRKQTSQIASDAQSLSHELHSPKLEILGLAAAVKGFCKEFEEQQKVEIQFKSHDLPRPLPRDISLSLFRVTQEALHNSAKHSGDRNFEVELWGMSGEIHLTVKDSGLGFDLDAAMQGRGLGLTSMEERLKAVNGTLSIASQPQRGTTIHARVPLTSGDHALRAVG